MPLMSPAERGRFAAVGKRWEWGGIGSVRIYAPAGARAAAAEAQKKGVLASARVQVALGGRPDRLRRDGALSGARRSGCSMKGV